MTKKGEWKQLTKAFPLSLQVRPEEPLLPPPVKTIRKVQSIRATTKVKGGKKEAHCPDVAYREDTVHKRIQRESSIKSIRLLGIKSIQRVHQRECWVENQHGERIGESAGYKINTGRSILPKQNRDFLKVVVIGTFVM